MLAIQEYEQTAVYDPNNPNQRIREVYAPGGYTSVYFNEVNPSVKMLQGLRGNGLGMSWATLPSWGQIAIVLAATGAVGYAAMAKFGTSHIKPGLRRVGINLSGPRFRRRRRR